MYLYMVVLLKSQTLANSETFNCPFCKQDSAGGRKAGMLSLVVCGLPICLPLALAFAIPDRSLEQPCPPGSPA